MAEEQSYSGDSSSDNDYESMSQLQRLAMLNNYKHDFSARQFFVMHAKLDECSAQVKASTEDRDVARDESAKLQRQVHELTDTMATKEAAIRRFAHEKEVAKAEIARLTKVSEQQKTRIAELMAHVRNLERSPERHWKFFQTASRDVTNFVETERPQLLAVLKTQKKEIELLKTDIAALKKKSVARTIARRQRQEVTRQQNDFFQGWKKQVQRRKEIERVARVADAHSKEIERRNEYIESIQERHAQKVAAKDALLSYTLEDHVEQKMAAKNRIRSLAMNNAVGKWQLLSRMTRDKKELESGRQEREDDLAERLLSLKSDQSEAAMRTHDRIDADDVHRAAAPGSQGPGSNAS